MSHIDSTLNFPARKQSSRISTFHLNRDNGLDLYNPDDTTGQTYLIDGPDEANSLSDITILLDDILPRHRARIGKHQETSQGRIVRSHNRNSRVIESCMQLSKCQFNGYRIDPDVLAVLAVNSETDARRYTGMALSFVIDGKMVYEHYVEYLKRLKAKLSTPAIKQWKRNQKLLEKRRFESILKAFDDATQLPRRYCLIRVDGSYKQSYRTQVSPSVIANDLDRLIGNMRHNKSQFSALILAIFKIEYGASKGYHWHGFFIYDGSMTSKDVLRGKYLLDYWCNVTTHGNGSGYNVNGTAAKRQLAKHLNVSIDHLALGQLHQDSLEQRANILAVCMYLAKLRQPIRISESPKIKQLRIIHGPRFSKFRIEATTSNKNHI